MHPRPIELYYCPTSVPEALALLKEHRGEAKLIAGGQSLMPLLKLRMAEARCLIDLNRIPALGVIREEAEVVRIGATARHAEVAAHPAVRGACRLLADAAEVIGDPQVRNRGTIGGSLAHADPAADYPAAAIALGARVSLARDGGRVRTLSVEDLIAGPLMTTVEEDELITEVQIPKPGPASGGAYAKHSVVAGDYAGISVAVQVALDAAGRCRQAAVVIGGVMPRPARAERAGELLVGT